MIIDDTTENIVHGEKCFYIPQDRIAVSTTGNWSLASGGFAGCMGVIIGPTDGSGGIIAHIAEGGAIGDAQGFVVYTDEIIGCLMRWLKPRSWNKVDVALFKGQGAHSYPNLHFRIRECFGSTINEVYDVRARSIELDSSGFYFDTISQTLYIRGFGGFPAATEATFTTYEKMGQEINFKHSKRMRSDGSIKYRYYYLP